MVDLFQNLTMPSTYSIAYISRANENLDNDEIKELLDYAATKNNVVGVKGMILFKDGNFLQVLEGEENQIVNLYEKIQSDERHTDLHEVFNEKSPFALFEDYNSKFNLITSSSELVALKSFFRRRKIVGFESDVSKELDVFLGMNWF